MRILFQKIRAGDVAGVAALLDDRPELVSAVAKAPPKKDDGQSPLQLAIKSGASNLFQVANLLLDRGADVNFQEESTANSWTAPVLHDALRAAVFSAPSMPDTSDVLTSEAVRLLRRLLDEGADVTVLDNKGNSALWRFLLDATQVEDRDANRVATDAHLAGIARLLIEHGADPRLRDERYGKSAEEFFAERAVARFLEPGPASKASSPPSSGTGRRWFRRA